jgi:hypothetical protein
LVLVGSFLWVVLKPRYPDPHKTGGASAPSQCKINHSSAQYSGEVRTRLTALLIAHLESPFQNRLEARIVGEVPNAPYNLC